MASAKSPALTAKAGSGSKRKKKILTVVVVVTLAVMLIGGVVAAIVAANWEEYKQYAADRKTVAVCNGYDIPYEELRFVTMFYKDMLADTYGSGIWEDATTAEQYRGELERLVSENLNQNYLVLSACDRLGIDTDNAKIDDYVDEQMEELRDSFASKAEYKAWMEEHWMTEHYMRFSIGIGYLESAIYYTLLDNKLYTYTLSNVDEFMDYVETSGEFVRTIHVYIENVDGEDPAANLARAQEISDILQAIEDPTERRAQMSEYIGSKDNDDLQSLTSDGYYFTRGEMDEIYEKAAFALEMGDVSEPVVCSGGNFIMMRLPPEEEYIAKNVQTLLNNYHSVYLGKYVDQFKPNCAVTFTEYGRSIDLVALQ